MPKTRDKVREPQQERSFETRANILDAALKVFAAEGFSAAKIRDIAELAGTTHPMITYHFGGKDKLWRAAVENMFHRLDQEAFTFEEPEPEDPVLRFKIMIARYVRYCARHPEHARITIAETVRGGERLKWMVKNFVETGHGNFVPLCQNMMDRGVIPHMSVTSFLYSLVGMSQLAFVLAPEAKLAFKVDMMSEEMIANQTEAVFQMIFRESAADYLNA